MEFNEVTFQAGLPIDGYGPGFFRLGDTAHQGPLLILPGGVTAWGGFDDPTPIIAAKDSFDVLLLGMGAEIAPAPPALTRALEGAGVGFDVMGTPPALRTYNVLLAEERRVALAALPV